MFTANGFECMSDMAQDAMGDAVDAFARILGVLSDDVASHMWAEDVTDAAAWHQEAMS
jgi:hypothetical protein